MTKAIKKKEYDPLHPYSVEQLLEMIRKKATIFQYKVRLRSHDLEDLEKINHSLDIHISQDFHELITMNSRFYKYTGKDLMDLKFFTADMISDLAKEDCFVR